jgi:hypothetical protein
MLNRLLLGFGILIMFCYSTSSFARCGMKRHVMVKYNYSVLIKGRFIVCISAKYPFEKMCSNAAGVYELSFIGMQYIGRVQSAYMFANYVTRRQLEMSCTRATE